MVFERVFMYIISSIHPSLVSPHVEIEAQYHILNELNNCGIQS